MVKIEDDFKKIHDELKHLERTYNPQNENLHFTALEFVDSVLYLSLSRLARSGLKTVQKHHEYFSKHSLYDDGMFWYNFFLLTSAAAIRVEADKTQGNIPKITVIKIVEILVAISEYSTSHIGDIVKRNYEALGNTLLTFYSEELINLIRMKSQTISSKRVHQFIERTIKRAEDIIRNETGL